MCICKIYIPKEQRKVGHQLNIWNEYEDVTTIIYELWSPMLSRHIELKIFTFFLKLFLVFWCFCCVSWGSGFSVSWHLIQKENQWNWTCWPISPHWFLADIAGEMDWKRSKKASQLLWCCKQYRTSPQVWKLIA